MLKTVIVDGVEHLVILERSSSDGGVVVCYLSPDKDGVHLSKRDWYQDPSMAQQVFDQVDAVVAKGKRDAALEMFVADVSAGVE